MCTSQQDPSKTSVVQKTLSATSHPPRSGAREKNPPSTLSPQPGLDTGNTSGMTSRKSLRASKSAGSLENTDPGSVDVFLSGPSVLLVNFDGDSLVHIENMLQRCHLRIDGPQFDVLNLGSSRSHSTRLHGAAPILALLKLPHPCIDPRGFSWTLSIFEQLMRRRQMRVVPVLRDCEQQPNFLRSIASSCPFYMSLLDDQEDQRQLLTCLIESIL
ncbi:hypothetical protein FQZ97_1010010 [compost metagenome]